MTDKETAKALENLATKVAELQTQVENVTEEVRRMAALVIPNTKHPKLKSPVASRQKIGKHKTTPKEK